MERPDLGKKEAEDVVKEKKKLAKYYYDLFTGSPHAKVVLDDLKHKFWMTAGMFNPTADNSEKLLYREGARNVILYVMSKIEDGQIN